MTDHIGDANKMIGETPRMKAAQMAAMEHGTGDVWRVGCDIERELNASNERIKRLEEKLRSVKRKQAVLVSDVVLYEDRGERIKQLEEALSCVVVSCAYLHHPKKYRHKLYEACPVENLIKKARKAKP